MASKQDETRRVLLTFAFVTAVQVPMFILQFGTLLGLPYWIFTNWEWIEAYFCGAQCVLGMKIMLVVGAMLTISAVTSGVFCVGALANLAMKDKVEYLKEFAESMKVE